MKKLTIEDMHDIAKERGGRCLSKTYVNVDTKLKWQCEKGHVWEAIPDCIKNRGQWCPYCSGKKALEENCLHTLNPSLAKEWHPTKNRSLTPRDVVPGSHNKVWWRCEKGHEWQARISHRSDGVGCPYCSGHRVCKDNCLQTVNPRVAREWHPTKNGSLTPKDVTPGTDKKVWWSCSAGHAWQASVGERSRGKGCPYCCGRLVCSDNCLETLNPSLAKEWHPTKNGSLTPKEVTPGSNKIVWWRCQNGHEWQVTVNNRTRGTMCPYCSGRLARDDNCLETLEAVQQLLNNQ